MSDRDPNHPLRQTLIETQQELQLALEEVCFDVEIDSKPTAELVRIEETLAVATETAKRAISLRQRLDLERQQPPLI